jgi:hypothetical protein
MRPLTRPPPGRPLLPRARSPQDVSGGKPVLLQGSDLPLWGMEVDPEEGKAEFAAYNKANNTGQQVGCPPGGWGGCEEGARGS